MKMNTFHYQIILIVFLIFFITIICLSRTLCIDAGHGNNTGSPGYNDQADPWEDDINLIIFDYCESELWSYYAPADVYATRITFNDNPSPTRRYRIANGLEADAYGYTCTGGVDYFISIHNNWDPNSSSTTGTSIMIFDNTDWTYSPDTTTARYKLAKSVINAYLVSTVSVYSNASTAYYSAGIVGRDSIAVLRYTNMPAILIECEFLSNVTTWGHLTDWYFNYDYDYVIAAGYGIADGIYYYSPIINSVGPKEPVQEISGFQLQENYPNPFNPTTTIKYDIEKATIVELEIFNTTGQLIKTLINDHKSSGSYNAVWDGTNNSGFSVASGTYICRLRSADYSKSIKLALLR